jgi:hypothetical protein
MRIRGTRRDQGTSCVKLDDAGFWTIQSLPFISPLEGHVLVIEDSLVIVTYVARKAVKES